MSDTLVIRLLLVVIAVLVPPAAFGYWFIVHRVNGYVLVRRGRVL